MLEVEVIRTQKTSNKPNEMAARAWNDRTGETSNVWVIKIVPTTLLYRYMTHIQYITRVSRVHQDSLYREATIGCGPLKPPDFIHTRSPGLSSAQVSVLRHTAVESHHEAALRGQGACSCDQSCTQEQRDVCADHPVHVLYGDH